MIRHDRRNRLHARMLDASLRIRLNGPTPEKYKGIIHAIWWKNSGHFLSDDSEQKADDDYVMDDSETHFVEYAANEETSEFANLRIDENSNALM